MTEHPLRIKLPDTRSGFTRKEKCGNYELYVTVSFYDAGDLSSLPGEVFVKVAKEGSVLAGMCDALATTISLALQHGVPWGILRDKYLHTRFEPSGEGQNGVFYPSIVHAIACAVDEVIKHRQSIWGTTDDLQRSDSMEMAGGIPSRPAHSNASQEGAPDSGVSGPSDVLQHGESGAASGGSADSRAEGAD